MNKCELILQYVFSNIFEIVLLFAFVFIFILRSYQLISQNDLLIVVIIELSAILIKQIFTLYINFMLTVRKTSFIEDNRTIHFLNFDAMKFLLIAISLFGLIYLGVNKVLNNETIATLLGGLVGSLLTMRGSYSDLKYSKEDMDLNKPVVPEKPVSTSSN